MRVLGSIPHPTFNIIAYTLENHYYVEIEAGPMKQCYKLHKETTDGMPDIQKWLNPDFLKEVQRIFEKMYNGHKAAISQMQSQQ